VVRARKKSPPYQASHVKDAVVYKKIITYAQILAARYKHVDAYDIETLCINAGLKAFKRADKTRPHYLGYIYRSMYNAIIDQFKIPKLALPKVSGYTLLEHTPNFILKEICNSLLPLTQKELYYIWFLSQDYTFEEIAKIMGIPLGTVCSEISRRRQIWIQRFER
jgi:DNA-directed RNA polymerase specialized sigma24 family protein